MDTYEGYCVKCRTKREFEGEATTGPSGRRMAKGKCPTCGTTVSRLLPSLKGRSDEGPEDLKKLLP